MGYYVNPFHIFNPSLTLSHLGSSLYFLFHRDLPLLGNPTSSERQIDSSRVLFLVWRFFLPGLFVSICVPVGVLLIYQVFHGFSPRAATFFTGVVCAQTFIAHFRHFFCSLTVPAQASGSVYRSA